MPRSLTLFLAVLIAFVLGFTAGMRWQQFVYVDTCLDAGGGIRPGSSMCVMDLQKAPSGATRH